MNTQSTVRFIGALYLLIALFGGFAFFAGYEALLVTNDARQTLQNIQDDIFIFRLGMIGDSFVFLSEIILTVLLYQLLKPVNHTLSLIAAVSRFIMTALIGMNVLNKLLVLQLISGFGYLDAFNTQQINALVMFFLHAYGDTTLIWGLFFALHLVIIGQLLCKSNMVPKFLVALVTLAGLGYFINSLGLFMWPQHKEILDIIVLSTVPAELSLAFWFLFKGIKPYQPRESHSRT